MRVIRYSHACVRLEHDGRVLVVDPGTWSEPEALIGADAVLATHEHHDHVDVLRLAGLGVPVFAPEQARLGPATATRVDSGDSFDAAGFRVRAIGGKHAKVWDQQAPCDNLGYLVEEAFYHPGDALDVPDAPVHTLAVPLHASWLRTEEAVAFLNAVDPAQAFGIHDGQLNDRGRRSVTHWMRERGTDAYRSLGPREAVLM